MGLRVSRLYSMTSMKSLRFALVAGALAALPLISSAAPRFYAQPSLVIVDVDNFDTAAGASVAVGAVFGGNHVVEFETSRFELSSSYGLNFDLTATPLLLNYRYEIATTERWLLSAGLSAGVMLQEIDFTDVYSFPGSIYHYNEKDEAFVVGFNAGIGYKIDDRLSIHASARTLRAAKSDVFSESSFLMLQLGLRCRF